MHLGGLRLLDGPIGAREIPAMRAVDLRGIARSASRVDRAVRPDSLSELVDEGVQAECHWYSFFNRDFERTVPSTCIPASQSQSQRQAVSVLANGGSVIRGDDPDQRQAAGLWMATRLIIIPH
jgi:hypothetical protein